MIQLRQFRSGGLNALYAISLATGHEGGDASHLYEDAKLMGHVYSAPYALLTYQTAYMKANYPVEFLAASMTLDMGNTDKLAEFRAEADRLKIKVEPRAITVCVPDPNSSRVSGAADQRSRTNV